MRRGLSLIELVFTIVIIAIVFTVIPKIVFSLKKSDSFVIRQDAMFNGASLANMIIRLPWDENNTDSRDILDTNSSNAGDANLTCDETTARRVGGFIGSRTCEENLSASVDFNDSDDFNDLDDYNDYNETPHWYGLEVFVKYVENNITYENKSAKILLSKSQVPNTTNFKLVDVNISYRGNRGEHRPLTQFNYTSVNIGQMVINKRVWGN